jgi:DNA/RNA-binding domain of Phe-tRNA-synthetase-like protein
MLNIAPHPLLDAQAFTTVFPAPLADIKTPPWLQNLLQLDAEAPMRSDDAVRAAVRDLLRHGGYKPTGRGKPASEYLIRAVSEGTLSSINAAVDVCNAVSLHSGLPISVIDLDRAQAPFSIAVAGPGVSYVFNATGQVIDLEGLLCLFDAAGPCANAVKDAQRTKTDGTTQRTLSVVWGSRTLDGRCAQAVGFYTELLQRLGAVVAP